jgi:phosphoribosylaminoimidazolecarboxamide formyltransferase/IMP cyclohydrolase
MILAAFSRCSFYARRGDKSMSDRWAFISVYEKSGIVEFARALQERHGFNLLSSGGTADFLGGAGLHVTTVKEVSGLGPILSHRVVTLVPQVHGGLLALDTEEHKRELEEIGGFRIMAAVVDFYPLRQEILRHGSNLESVRNQTDIGGPTAIMSAVKGARYPICTPEHRLSFLRWLEEGEPEPKSFALTLQAAATMIVSEYYGQLGVYLQLQMRP